MDASGYTQRQLELPDSGLRGPGVRRRRNCCYRGVAPLVPLELLVPACSESCFSIFPPYQHSCWESYWENCDEFVRVRKVGGGRACSLHVGGAGSEGGYWVSTGFAR